MIKEPTILGIAGIILGAAMAITTKTIFPALIPTTIGIALILFCKEENKIENRKDIKTRRYK